MATATIDQEDTGTDLIDPPKGFEVLDGELVEMPDMGFQATQVAGEIYTFFRVWNTARHHGVVVFGEGQYACFPDDPRKIRRPDVSFIVCDPSTFAAPLGSYTSAPDLIVEVLSPSNTMTDIAERVDDFLAAGTKLAWVIDPVLRTALIHYPDDTIKKVRDGGILSGEAVLPGFTLPLSDVLPRVAAKTPRIPNSD
jgi:Uma2 family endonuclease